MQVKKYLWLLLLTWPLKPVFALTTVATGNAYMVQNTSGTDTSGNFCYDFQTRPSCSARITNLTASISTASIPGGATSYIQNRDTLQSGATFYVSSGTIVSGTINTAIITSATMVTQTITSSKTWNGPLLTGNVLTAGTSGQVLASQGNNLPPYWTSIAPSGSCFNLQYSSISASTATTVTTQFVPTPLSKSITLTSASNRVKITVGGVLESSLNGQNAFLDVYAGAKRGMGPSGGSGIYRTLIGTAAGLIRAGSIPVVMDSPLITGATTYTVMIQADTTNTAKFAENSFATMILEECTP